MPMFRTTVYIDLDDKKRLEALSQQTSIPEARLWREALELLFQRRTVARRVTRAQALRALRQSVREFKIDEAYDTYKREERRLEAARKR